MSPTVHALDRARASSFEIQRPGRAEVEAAVRTIIRWTGDDPERDGLRETPARVTRSFEEFFAGYGQDPTEILEKTFEEIEGYDEMIVLRGIRFESHCEHHMAPIVGQAWVAYIPNGRVVGICKLARVVDVYAKRLQIQEKMTAQIANTVNSVLKPLGVGVIIKASHHCMTTRGVHKPDTDLVTSRMLGCFRDSAPTRQEFLGMAFDAADRAEDDMADQQAPPAGPDLSQGVALSDFSGATLARPCRRRRRPAGAFGIGDFRDRRPLQPLSRAARRGPRRRRHGSAVPGITPVSILRTGEAAARAGARSDRGLEGRAAKAIASSFGEKREQARRRSTASTAGAREGS